MTISRRQFFAALGAAGLSTAALPVFASGKKTQSLRVISYNVYACAGWPKDRPLAKSAVKKGQMARRLAMELALYEPDIINFSESPSEAIAKEVAEYLGMHHVRFPSGGNWPGTLLSRFEITDSENVPLGHKRPKDLFTRHWGRGTIKLPNGESLIVHSAHLFPTPDPSVRLKEIKAMLVSMKEDLDAGRSMLLIGDLNHNPETEEYKLWMDAGWIDTFAKVGEGEGLTIRADDPKHRIDYVMATGPIAHQIVESRPLFEGAFRLNVADENSFALSDHLPQLAVFGQSD
ncbi:endonuclease/exonuclease/phosphatase family protein [Thalassoglobus polymorphus]|uniref:Endonuclease/Exonuclease/phosphatase family protein n=1 Tax=Thalassoglobus polymorphus TaxID=2527994 RepID=A0A517QNL1_9PLAN|nr:endonuclease/exonuclease/phosphatase family protein [Thalassoglobus polymorphus]QDT33222.1 Endonuclease/Exonuclease/phosphatase family protein [Thalassoglobus polymorphus]